MWRRARGAQIGQGISHGPEENVQTVDADGVANTTSNVVYCGGECRRSAVFGGAPGVCPVRQEVYTRRRQVGRMNGTGENTKQAWVAGYTKDKQRVSGGEENFGYEPVRGRGASTAQLIARG